LLAAGASGARGEGPAPTAPPKDDGSALHPVNGPAKVDLGHELMVEVPEGYFVLQQAEAKALMERLGNLHNENLLAILAAPESTWLATVAYVEEGYVKDDDAAKLDADEILSQIRESVDAENAERSKRGFAEVHVDGWTESPRYDKKAHQLVWGIRGSSKDGVVINEYRRVLGRKGHVSINLIDDAEHIGASKAHLPTLLTATHFVQGARYEDFDSKRDKVAKYGLAALILGGGGAAALKIAKIGLLAKFGGKLLALLLAAKKAIIVGLLAVGAFLKKVFGGSRKGERDTPAPPPPGPAGTGGEPPAAP
jgi:uncharacterized membrane-anchored protein